MRRPDRTLLIAVFAILTLIWGTTWAVIRVGLRGIPPFSGVALRFAIASVALLSYARLKRIPLGSSSHEKSLWLVNGTLAFSTSYGVVYWSEQWVPSGLAAVLFATFPLFVALLAHFGLPAERLSPRAAVGVLVGFAGAAVIFSEDLTLLGGPGVLRASAVMLVSPAVSAVASVWVKRCGKGIHPVSLGAVPMAICAACMGLLAFATERRRPFIWDASSLAALFYLAIFGSAVTFTLYYWLLSRARATRVSLIAYTVPVVAVAVGILVMGEPLTARVLAGATLVLGGVAMAVHSPAHPLPPTTPS